MTTYAERIATELRNRYDDHDREGFEAALRRMVTHWGEGIMHAPVGPLPLGATRCYCGQLPRDCDGDACPHYQHGRHLADGG